MARRDRRAARSARRGQALVEFALILPVFLVLTLGVVDGARMFMAYISLTNGVREAALYGSQGTGYRYFCAAGGGGVACPAGTAAANQRADPENLAYQIWREASNLDASRVVFAKPQCDGVPCDSGAGPYSTVTVSASYPMDLFLTALPIIGTVWPQPVTLSASTVARVIP